MFIAGERLDGTGSAVAGQGEIRDCDRKHVLAADIDVQRALDRRGQTATADLYGEFMATDRLQVFGDKLALGIQRMRAAIDGDVRIFRQVAPADADARTMDRDVLHAQTAVAEHGVGQAARLRLIGIQALSQLAFRGIAQALPAAFRFVRSH